MDMKFTNMNTAPVLTYRWMGVNDISIYGYSCPEIRDFKGTTAEGVFQGNIEILRDKVLSCNEDYKIDDNLKFGVSKDSVKLSEEYSNSSMIIKTNRNEKDYEPIKIKHIFSDDNKTLVDHNIIVAEENSKVTVIMEYLSDGQEEAFHNGLTKIFAKNGAEVTVIKVQMMNKLSYNFDSNVAFVGYGAKVNYINVDLGGKYSVTNYVSNLEDTEANADLRSVYLGDGERVIDINYVMNHIGRRTESNIETKGALKDKCKKIFRGTIDFKRGSARSKGVEEEYVTLLDKDVKSDAIPLLLCEEDDVEGVHAASAGKIDENKLFYLMSRGFGEREAKKLIIEASFRPIIDLIDDEAIRASIDEEIQRRLVNA
ncbi:Fe-S cluster assembly protein SufD [Clostridium hydrogeniformans]|uniref:Fe-S cluster assembly protein SufD n=1 Tax=Clostridium hydrogeniformans TaxID=349933 RepID=UPI000488E83E|nr:Fe-S cluster assembly protein SufD [Clostridium hydrogeniformans]